MTWVLPPLQPQEGCGIISRVGTKKTNVNNKDKKKGKKNDSTNS